MTKKHLIVHNYLLRKILDQIKEIIGIGKFNDTKILIDTYDELPDDVILKRYCGINDMRHKR